MLQIKCTNCGELKNSEEFPKNKTQCKFCKSEKNKEHYRNNKQYYFDKARKNTAQQIDRLRLFVLDYFLSHPCVDCGETNPVVLDFHHERDKIATIAQLVHNGCSTNKLKREIDKCIVLCSNCHRIRHAKDDGWWKFMLG